MYKAIHTQTGEEIIILHPHWRKHIEALRDLDRADLLVCQGCRQPLRVKAGEVKRPHFAHKHLKACSYGSETPEILNARGVLYEWLLGQFGLQVNVEKQVEGLALPRPVDCWVECGATRFAYWIIEAGIKLEPREAIRAAFAQLGVPVQYVFLQAMLNEEKKEFHSLLLTPTERAFLQTTPYDAALAGAGETGQSLHYLDADGETLTTYRALHLFHRPNWFKGVRRVARLEVIKAGRADGGFIYPGEVERLVELERKQQRLAARRARYAEREPGWQRHLAERQAGQPADAWKEAGQRKESKAQGGPEPLPCAICGQITEDYWSVFTDETGRRLCRCRECLDREGGSP